MTHSPEFQARANKWKQKSRKINRQALFNNQNIRNNEPINNSVAYRMLRTFGDLDWKGLKTNHGLDQYENSCRIVRANKRFNGIKELANKGHFQNMLNSRGREESKQPQAK
ncbi:MAG: hypothetical protein MK137_06020 [Rickettsiales bacterium]|nr:hypothetical protein [Rickettsiales bacterium]